MATFISEKEPFSEENYVLCAAIDFGTTYSGYAFSFKNSPESIKMNKNWSENMGFHSYKTPTCVLTGPDDQFKLFGIEAEQAYSEIMVDQELSKSHNMYRHFKMMLYEVKRITRETMITSTTGRRRRALDIFAMSLRFLKDHLLETIRGGVMQFGSSTENMIKWVITVPAIWSDEAKQFMREAAFQAGLISTKDSRQLVIALEPEAASLFCRSLEINHFIGGEDGQKSANFETGTKYMVIDAGGGTIDITVHEVLENKEVKEIHAANGGAWGGKRVDDNFIALLREILGDKFIDAYQKENPNQWLSMMTNFEKVKKAAKPDGKSKLVLPLSWSMGQKYQEVMGDGIEKAIKKAQGLGVGFANGAFILHHEAVVRLFQPIVAEIVAHIEALNKIPEVRACSHYLLVGGFGESPFLQDAIEKKFGSKVCLLVPNEAQMSVIKGAVLFGHKPGAIKSRKSKKTYGIEISTEFNKSIHNRDFLDVCDGIPYCHNIFDPYVQKGEDVPVGSIKEITYYPIHAEQTLMHINIFTKDKRVKQNEVPYITDRGMEQKGKFIVNMPDTTGGKGRQVLLLVQFGGTEIQIQGTDQTSGNTAQVSVDFLTE